MNRRLILSVLCLTSLGAQVWGAETPAAAPSNGDLQELRARIAEQQEQIKHLQQAVDEQQKLLERSLANAGAPAAGSSAVASTTGGEPAKMVPVVNVVHPNIASSPRAQGGENKPSPLSVSIGNTTFTPLGFVDATFFARSTNVGSGIGTNFAGIPFNTAATEHLSETNFSAQNSRIGFRVDSNFMGAKILGYVEADFLFNNNSTTYQVSSNAAGFRLRNMFVDATKNGFEIMGGQDWTFLTPNRKGLSPIPGDIFYTQNMDTNYQAGLIWARQPQFRFIAHPNEDFAFGVSIENPQQYIGGSGGASTVVLPGGASGGASTLNGAVIGNFQANNAANSSSNVPNWFPDIIFKGAYDGHAGDKLLHVEAAGLVRGFKDYVTLTTAPAIHGSHTAIGYGGSVNANLEIVKNVRLIANTFFSDGGGRYIFGIAPDLVVRPDGSISPLHSYSTVDGFEAQVSKNTLIGAYYGAAYVGRNISFDPTQTGSTLAKPLYSGYGTPSGTQNRDVQQITFDWVQTLWKNPSYGALSLINQYSYVLRDPWFLAVGAPKSAHSNLIYVDLRYTLP